MKCFAIITCLMIPLAGMSQFTKGGFLVSGDLSLNATDAYTSYAVTPSVGLFVVDGLALGLSGGVGGYDEKNTDNSSSQFAIGPMVEKLIEINERVSFSLKGQVLYRHISEPTELTIMGILHQSISIVFRYR